MCDGLDTVATVLVNGQQVGRFSNQHRSYRIPVAHVLHEGENELEVVFDSAWAYAEHLKAELGDLPNAYPTRSTSSARWPATSAGTGARRW